MNTLNCLSEADGLLVKGYLTAKEYITSIGYSDDIDWAETLGHRQMTPQLVLRESAWVVVNAGFRYSVVHKLWPGLMKAFLNFEPEKVDMACIADAWPILHHLRKLTAIVDIAAEVRRDCPRILREAKEPTKLTRLPYIGKVTCWHLAKLLGADVVKPDVHLVRAATAAGTTPQELCRLLGSLCGDRATTVDSVLWRWGEQKKAKAVDWEKLWQRRV